MILTTLHNDPSGQRGEILLNSYIISRQTQIVFYLGSHFSSRHINFRQYQRNAWIFYPAQQTHRNIYLDFLQARHKKQKTFHPKNQIVFYWLRFVQDLQLMTSEFINSLHLVASYQTGSFKMCNLHEKSFWKEQKTFISISEFWR